MTQDLEEELMCHPGLTTPGPRRWATLGLSWQTAPGSAWVSTSAVYFNKAFTMNGSGTSAKPTEEYKYLDGRCRHYKLIGRFLFGSIVLVG